MRKIIVIKTYTNRWNIWLRNIFIHLFCFGSQALESRHSIEILRWFSNKGTNTIPKKHLLKVNSPGVVIRTTRRNSVKCQCLLVRIWKVKTFVWSSLSVVLMFKSTVLCGKLVLHWGTRLEFKWKMTHLILLQRFKFSYYFKLFDIKSNILHAMWMEIKGPFALCYLRLRFIFAHNGLHRSWWCCRSRIVWTLPLSPV